MIDTVLPVLQEALELAEKTCGGRCNAEFNPCPEAELAAALRTEILKRAPIKYRRGRWFKAQSVDEMERFFYSRLPAIRKIADTLGYAIAVHGSCRRDFDLMAMQWDEKAADKDTLAKSIAIAACGITHDGPCRWEKKPMGRVATSIPICWTKGNRPSEGMIDLSLIDPLNVQTT